MAAPERGEGLFAGCSFFQALSAQVQVSPRTNGGTPFSPPNSTMARLAASKTMAAELLAGGWALRTAVGDRPEDGMHPLTTTTSPTKQPNRFHIARLPPPRADN